MTTDIAIATPSTVYVEWLVGQMDLPCEFTDKPFCEDQPAAWVMHRKPCCTAKLAPALACDTCKDNRLHDRIALECRECGFIWEHAPDAYFLIEALNRRPS